MGKPIRVLIANRPRLMRELILASFLEHPDIEIVDEVPGEADVLASVEKVHPDFVVITQDTLGERPSVCDFVLRQQPNIRFIAIVPQHNFAVYYWASMKINSRSFEASEKTILGVLRDEGSAIGRTV